MPGWYVGRWICEWIDKCWVCGWMDATCECLERRDHFLKDSELCKKNEVTPGGSSSSGDTALSLWF